MNKTKIQWTDVVWNPVTGCTKVSEGCRNCYAETIANRFWGDRKFTDIQCHEDRLSQPLRWKKPRRVFVNSMSDLFHEDVPNAFIDKVFAVMALSTQHTFQILTKRPERMWKYCIFMGDERFSDRWDAARNWLMSIQPRREIKTMGRYEYIGIMMAYQKFPLPNAWLGVSIEDQKTADDRVPILLQTPAAVRFVSYEPALGSVDFTHDLCADESIDWIIMGGESGQHARPMNPDWARSVRDQCQEAGVPFFMKQMAKKTPIPDDLFVREFPEVQ